mgnify:CR=1 FL=1
MRFASCALVASNQKMAGDSVARARAKAKALSRRKPKRWWARGASAGRSGTSSRRRRRAGSFSSPGSPRLPKPRASRPPPALLVILPVPPRPPPHRAGHANCADAAQRAEADGHGRGRWPPRGPRATRRVRARAVVARVVRNPPEGTQISASICHICTRNHAVKSPEKKPPEKNVTSFQQSPE